MTSSCLCCGANLNKATGVNSKQMPELGDYSVCFYCASIGQFDASFNLIQLTASQIQTLARQDKKTYEIILNVQNRILLFILFKNNMQ
jgi:hypothetical protein